MSKNLKVFKNGLFGEVSYNYVLDEMSQGQIIVQSPMSKDDALEVLHLMENPKEFYQNAFVTSIFPFLSTFCYIDSDDISRVFEICFNDIKENKIIEKSKLHENFVNFIVKYQDYFNLNMKLTINGVNKNLMLNMGGYNSLIRGDEELGNYKYYFDTIFVKDFLEDFNLSPLDYKTIRNYVILNKSDTHLYSEFLFDVANYNAGLTVENEDDIRRDISNLLDEIVSYHKFREEQL